MTTTTNETNYDQEETCTKVGSIDITKGTEARGRRIANFKILNRKTIIGRWLEQYLTTKQLNKKQII